MNTSDFESNPTISSDGRRLAFERASGGSVSVRHLVADLATGQSADLFTGFEIAQDPITRSAIAPDGATVATGRSFRAFLGFVLPRVTLTSLQSFPSGPFSRSGLTLTRRYASGASIRDVAIGGSNLFALGIRTSQGHEELVLAQTGGSSAVVRSASQAYSQPALAATNPQSVLFVERRVLSSNSPGNIVFRPATLAGFAGTPTSLFQVNTPRDESLPALTADGRYVGFVRDAADADDRLFVWDSQTQTFLNPNGIDLGQRLTRLSCDSLKLYTRSVIGSSVISRVGNVNVTLAQASSIGIFVQRIVGKTKVLGRKAYELETVGRVPLGSYGAGNVFTHWDFAVNGEPLPPGRYLVTLRAVEGDVVRELGQPQVLRIHDRPKHR